MSATICTTHVARRVLAVFALCCLMAAGCSPAKHVVRVETNSQPLEQGKRFLVVPGIMDVKPGDPRFKSVAAQLTSLLAGKGYVPVASYDQADLAVYVTYVVKDSWFGRGGVAPVQLQPAQMQPVRLQAAAGPAGGPALGATVGQMMGFAGPRGLAPEVVYDLSMYIEAVDLEKYKRNDPKHIVWWVRVASSGLSGDVSKAMPFITAAISDYIGKTAYVTLEVDENNNVTVKRPHSNKPIP